MFGTIRRHQTWLWIVIVIITVITFVVFFSPNSKYRGQGGGGSYNFGSISGEPVTAQAYRQAQAEVFIYYFLNHGDWPDKDASAKQLGFDIERETYFRLFFIQKFKELNIHVGQEAIGEQAAQILRGIGRGNPVPLQTFESEVLNKRGYTIADFRRFLEHQLALHELITIVGMSGRTTSTDEAAAFYDLQHQQISADAVFFSPSNLLNSITVTANDASQFYTNQMARYRLPDRVQVSYVEFPVSNFLTAADEQIAKLTNFAQNVEAIYNQRGGTNYYTDLTPAEAHDKIKEEFRNELALRAARNHAAQVADGLMSSTPAQLAAFDEATAKEGLTVKTTAPFNAQAGPAELEVPETFARSAFKLTAEEPFSGPIPATDGVYLLAFKKRFPSEIPAFSDIKEQVTADLRMLQAMRATYVAGTNIAHTITTNLAAGKTFAAACEEAKLEPVKLPAFSLSTSSLPEVENHVSLGRLQDVAFGIPAGKVSGFVPTDNGGGFILHVISRTAGATPETKSEFPAFLEQIRQTRQSEIFNAWFSREAARALRDTPMAQRKQEQP